MNCICTFLIALLQYKNRGLHLVEGRAMKITEVKVFTVNEEKLKAYVTIVLDDCFVVRDLKVIHGTSGLFVAMPSKKRKDGTYKDIAHPLNQETRAEVEKTVLEAYVSKLKEPQEEGGEGEEGGDQPQEQPSEPKEESE